MNAHLIHIVEGPLAGDDLAANEAILERSAPRLRPSSLSLVPAHFADDPVQADATEDNAERGTTNEQDDYVLDGHAGI